MGRIERSSNRNRGRRFAHLGKSPRRNGVCVARSREAHRPTHAQKGSWIYRTRTQSRLTGAKSPQKDGGPGSADAPDGGEIVPDGDRGPEVLTHSAQLLADGNVRILALLQKYVPRAKVGDRSALSANSYRSRQTKTIRRPWPTP